MLKSLGTKNNTKYAESSIYKTLGAWGQCYKTFSVCDFRIFVLCESVCLTRPEKLSNDNHSSLLWKSLIYVKKSFKTFGPQL